MGKSWTNPVILAMTAMLLLASENVVLVSNIGGASPEFHGGHWGFTFFNRRDMGPMNT